MNLPGLPSVVADTIEGSSVAEFVTYTANGVPIDTPLLHFVGRDGRTCDMTTGLAYPAKAERARRNPHVALFFEGSAGPDGPAVLVQALAAVRDADIQANTDRYVDACLDTMLAAEAGRATWEQMTSAIWYWPRVWIECHPVRALWWPDGNRLDDDPQRWDADASALAVQSDPAPSGKGTPPAPWPEQDWRERARAVLALHPRPHLSMVDGEFPSVVRVRRCSLDDDVFTLDVPSAVPGDRAGPVSLCFAGRATFVGHAVPDGDVVRLPVERMLPVLPLIDTGAIVPDPAQREVLLARLDHELARRGQPRPVINAVRPD